MYETRFLSVWDENDGWLADEMESSSTHDIESYSLQINHYLSTFREGRKPVAHSDRDLEGYFHIPGDTQPQRDVCKSRPDARREFSNKQLTNTAPCYINASDIGTNEPDTFRLAFLFDVMGVDLDDVAGPNRGTVRSEGINIQLIVKHLNSLPWKGRLGKIVYVYHFEVLPHSLHNEDHENLMDLGSNLRSSRRLVVHPSYINLKAREVPGLRRWTLTATLSVFARLAVLFTVVRFLVRFLAEHCSSSLKESYQDLLTTTSPDYHDLQQLASLDDLALKRSLSEIQLNIRFDRRRAKKQLVQYGWESGMHLRRDTQRELEMSVMV